MSGHDRTAPVAVALSGGVDSSVAAALLLEAGHEVFGVTMRLNDGGDDAIDKAAAVSKHLGVAHYVVDCREAFRDRVLRSCWEEYSRGRTPNPCIICNPSIKFGVLADAARGLGAIKLATGHHAKIVHTSDRDSPHLWRGADKDKDQSYFLAALTSSQLNSALFPIGALTKGEVRELARVRGLPSAETPESQDTCIALSHNLEGREGAFAETLRQMFRAPEEGGTFVDLDGQCLGHYEGIHRFTIGQRRGLGLALGRRAYVARVDAARRQVVVTTDPHALRVSTLRATGMKWHIRPPEELLHCRVQIRYRHRATQATISSLDEDTIVVDFVKSVAAVTPGQGAVLYGKEEVLGCGTIA